MSTPEQIAVLIIRSLRKEISAEEQKELSEWMAASDSNRKTAESFLLEDQLDNNVLRHWVKDTIWTRLEELIAKEKKQEPAVLHRLWIRWAAAAVILLVAGTYFISSRRGSISVPLKKQLVSEETDRSPASNRAMLTLNNGSAIMLDSVRNGTLVIQGSSTVVKLADGKLAYSAPASAIAAGSYNTLSTPRGGVYQLSLPDGTKVWLNAASSITYPTAFNRKERTVTVTGELYFEVVHNSKQPFRVETSGLVIEDVGTSFNINTYQDQGSINTTLLNGAVKVSVSGKKQSSNVLEPGQQAQVLQSSIHIVKHVNLERVMAWKNGKLSLTNSSVEQVMKEISRWYDVDIKYAGAVPNKTFYAVIDRNVPLSVVLHGLQAYGVQTKLEGKTLTVQ